ncbi:hypothetical protein DFH09DRAFT_1394058 [Mycena vulgaris]|nr:hypothetical protein DFH09DRAFT_1394058 [Mycena vulgaris]
MPLACRQMFTKPYIGANSHIFLGTGWISIPALRSFLEARDHDDRERDTIVISSSPEPPPSLYSRVKRESDAIDLTLKSEPGSAPLPFRTRSRTEGGREVIELLSDAEEEEGPAISLTQNGDRDVRSSTPDLSNANSDVADLDLSDAAELDPGTLQESDTVWLDPHVSSMVRVVRASFTSDARTYVDNMEYLTEIPSVLPVPRVPTAYVLDLSAAKFNLVDKHGHLIPVDGLMKSEINDSWTGNEFTMSHRTYVIPYNVDETLLEKLFANKPLANDKSVDTKPCSRIVHPYIGGKLRFCRYPHIIDGSAVTDCPIVHRACPSKLTFCIPIDPAMRKVLLFHPKGVPHNHPIPPPLKLSHGSKKKYRECVAAVGLIGCTVAKVDNGISFFDRSILSPADNLASSTQLLLDGQMPGQFTPALQGSRIKRDIIREEKKKIYPARLGIPGRICSIFHRGDSLTSAPGAYQLYREDLAKPMDERYIHRFQHMPGGGLIIFTCFTALPTLLDDTEVKVFEDDTTFKRIQGDLDEWEVVIFYNALKRAITLARAYINRSDTKFFELLFDMFGEIRIEATGRDIDFARFMPNGNLLVMNADMEAAQALGAAQSFMKTNVPSFSDITTLDLHLFATFFIKFCGSHTKRYEIPIATWRLNANCFYASPLQDFKSLIPADDFKRLKDFM